MRRKDALNSPLPPLARARLSVRPFSHLFIFSPRMIYEPGVEAKQKGKERRRILLFAARNAERGQTLNIRGSTSGRVPFPSQLDVFSLFLSTLTTRNIISHYRWSRRRRTSATGSSSLRLQDLLRRPPDDADQGQGRFRPQPVRDRHDRLPETVRGLPQRGSGEKTSTRRKRP